MGTARGTAVDGKRSGRALSAQGLTKRCGDRVAFEEVSCEIGYGEVFGFLGPTGAGKTTTVRTLSALIAPTSGSAMVTGLPLTPGNGGQIRQRIAIMPEALFSGVPGVVSWRPIAAAAYLLTVSDTTVAAPSVTRALVAAGADVRSIAESHYSLKDVYLELIGEEREAGTR
jgi:ABC-type hemin transport system ATPase subunit